MKSKFSSFGAAVSAFAIGSLSISVIPPSFANHKDTNVSATVSGLLKKLDQAFEKSECGNVNPLISVFDSNAVVYEPIGSFQGRTSVQAYFNSLFCDIDNKSTPGPDHKIIFNLVESGGDSNTVWATGTLNVGYPLTSGMLYNTDLRFTYIWEKSSDGTFKIVSSHGSGPGGMRKF